MLQILIILGWVIAAGFLVYLAAQAIKHRIIGRGQKNWAAGKAKVSKKRNDFDEKRRQGASLDGAAASPAPHNASLDYRRGITIVGYLSLFLWEAFWISEIGERFTWSADPFQLPYFFLLVVLVGVPVAVYLYARRAIRRSVSSS